MRDIGICWQKTHCISNPPPHKININKGEK